LSAKTQYKYLSVKNSSLSTPRIKIRMNISKYFRRVEYILMSSGQKNISNKS